MSSLTSNIGSIAVFATGFVGYKEASAGVGSMSRSKRTPSDKKEAGINLHLANDTF
jgi:hypothetical protein